MKIEFSIIMPIYNCNYFENAIDSVLQQSYQNWELIIIDNNKNNDVLKVIKTKKNRNIKYFKIKNRGIIGMSRNLGIKKSKNAWIAFIDSDDFWYKTKLNEVVRRIQKGKVDFIYHNMHTYSEKKSIFNKKLYTYEAPNKYSRFENLIINGNDIIQSSVVLRKSILKKSGYLSEKKNLIAWEDFDLWIRISMCTDKFVLVNKCLGKYFISENKIIKHNRFIKNIKNFEKKYKYEIEQLKKNYNIKEIWWIVYAKALQKYNIKEYDKSIKELNKIKLKYNKSYLNMIYIRSRIFLKTIFKK